MTEPRWNLAKQIFHEALDKSGPERAQFVAAACADDHELRAQVEAWLSAHDEAGTFLTSSTGPEEVARTAAGSALTHPPEGPGTRIGPYKLLQVIGEGGFGIVYMAEQEQPIRRRVALKIIKLGMDTKAVIARFEAERQALALMDHPNIARVLDAGATESGRPYFVMELVKGVPITAYCDANRLDTRERLELFTDVCKAIHHAHEKGIVHRDIKPSNVMVTLHDGTPVPKIIDFGVAKATNQRLTEKTLFTAYGEFVGTPAYMSPEQTELSGLEIDRRSDIYSLGVLLYELLTGTTPFEAESLRTRGFLEVMRIIREEDPPTPSARLHTLGDRVGEIAGRRQVEPAALTKLVRGDLDWIVMKALEKDRRRRYGSASELREDLGHYFRHEPVIARRPSAAYRLSKFAKRRQRSLLAAAAIVVAVVLGLTLARIGGFASGRSSAPASPVRRLVLDRAGQWNASLPTQDGRHLLRYDLKRRGYELVEIASGQTTRLTSAGPDPAPRLFVNHSLSPDQRAVAAVQWLSADGRRQPGRDNDGGQELWFYEVGGSGAGKLLLRSDPGQYMIQVFGWSPDQASIWVFILRADRSAEIASVAVAGGSRRVMKTFAWRTDTQTPSLSPDGRFIAYHDADTPSSPPDIFLIATDGSREIRVKHPASDSKPLFAPDGSGVVFQSTRRGRDLWFLPVVDGRPAGEPRPVWNDIGPYGQAMLFAENGSLVYFFATNAAEIYTAAIDVTRGRVGPPEHVQPRPGEMNTAPAFSPDGRFLAHLRGQGRRLVLSELATRVEREFPISGALYDATIDICPNGRTVLVSGTNGSGGSDAFRVDLDRGGAEPLSIAGSRAVCLGNGGDIVYLRSRSGQRSQVFRRSLVTGTETILHDGPVDHHHLARSPDGSHIAFVAVGSDAQLVVMPSAGGNATPVASSPIVRGGPGVWTEFEGVAWLPTGNELLVTRGTPGEVFDPSPEVALWRVPLDGHPAAEIGRMRLPAYEDAVYGSGKYSVNPDGSRIAFERHAGLVNQYWAIDNLLQFIQSGASIAVPVPRR